MIFLSKYRATTRVRPYNIRPLRSPNSYQPKKSPSTSVECRFIDTWARAVERGMVGLYGRPGVGETYLFIDQPACPGDSRRATIKAHHPFTQPPSPLRNPGLGLVFLFLLICLLAACGDSFVPTSTIGPIDTPTTHSRPNTTPAIMAVGHFREYALPDSKSGLMRPAIDHSGRIWFGEMGHNFLAVFDPHTQKFQQITPPHGRSGIMGVVVASDDTIWFAEQYANYIGHYYPASGQFQTYPLPSLTIPDPGQSGKTLTLPSAPNDLSLDKHGNIWFTELNANALGRLDTQSGLIQQYPLSVNKGAQTLNPYGIAIDPQGYVWFTEASTNHLGRLDPTTGLINYFTIQGSSIPLMEIAADAHGIIWATSFSSGLLLRLNPNTGTFTFYYTPSTGGIYGIVITPTDQVWVTITAGNAIAHLDVAANRFIEYAIPSSGSLPLGVVMGANNTLWFTEAGVDKIGMLRP